MSDHGWTAKRACWLSVIISVSSCATASQPKTGERKHPVAVARFLGYRAIETIEKSTELRLVVATRRHSRLSGKELDAVRSIFLNTNSYWQPTETSLTVSMCASNNVTLEFRDTSSVTEINLDTSCYEASVVRPQGDPPEPVARWAADRVRILLLDDARANLAKIIEPHLSPRP